MSGWVWQALPSLPVLVANLPNLVIVNARCYDRTRLFVKRDMRFKDCLITDVETSLILLSEFIWIKSESSDSFGAGFLKGILNE